jgi:hypothetical protein
VVAARLVEKLTRSSAPEKCPMERAGAIMPRNAAGSVGGTARPEPSSCDGLVASHSTLKLTVDGTRNGLPNRNVSMTVRSLASTIARLAFLLERKAPGGSSTVQKSPKRKMPPLLS